MSDSIFEKLAWLDKTSNPFGVRCLDCRIFSRSMLSTTKDPNVAAQFSALRKSTGTQYIGTLPPNVVTVRCDLSYPHNGQSKDGPLFTAEVMEDKWDIFLYDGYLCFVRSWTGDLVFRAKISFTMSQANITVIDANAQVASQNSAYIVQQVDFLIKSHLYKREVPHPLPADLPNEIQPIALYSFSQYGRWASFATYEDTSQIRIT
jgi:hypothetical protein